MEAQNISPKQAVEASSEFYSSITGNHSRLTLEEVKFDSGFWYVTLGIEKTGFVYGEKEYTVFKVDALSGNVESMSIKE